MTFDEYQMRAARTINEDTNTCEQEFHALHGMVAEIGELHAIYQKVYQGHTINEDDLKKELGDMLWFMAEYCTASGCLTSST